MAGDVSRSTPANQEGTFEKAQRGTHFGLNPFSPVRLPERKAPPLERLDDEPPLRSCQTDCLKACAKGARIIEMACGTGKTRVMKELAKGISGRVPCLTCCVQQFGWILLGPTKEKCSHAKVLVIVPLLALLDQIAPDFPGFCKVGTGHNQKIDFGAEGFVAVARSVHLLKSLKFAAIFVDEAHHPLPPGMPKCKELYRFSATPTDDPDFRYKMGQGIEDGVLCDYDITVPAVTEHHAYVCLADLLVKQAGRFRRVLAYCNTVAEAKKFQMVLKELGLAARQINGATSRKRRTAAIEEFSGILTKPVHVMVTVEVLGEGINIPNADTCMFVEPRNSYRSVIQAIERVLRHHPGKTLAHIVLPAVAVPAKVGTEAFSSDLASSEMGGIAGIVQGHAAIHMEHEGPEQFVANLELPVVDMPRPNTEESARESNENPGGHPTTSSRGIDAVGASTREDRTGPARFCRETKRGASNAEKEKPAKNSPTTGQLGLEWAKPSACRLTRTLTRTLTCHQCPCLFQPQVGPLKIARLCPDAFLGTNI